MTSLVRVSRTMRGCEKPARQQRPWRIVVVGPLCLPVGQDARMCFPVQPLKLRVQMTAKRCVSFTVGNDSENVDAASLMLVLAERGKTFFGEMSRFVPGDSGSWLLYADRCDRLLQVVKAGGA